MTKGLSHWMWALLLLYALVAIVFSYNLGLTEQEAYYWLWSKNLDWGYFDHPPFQAWVTALLSYLLGDEKWVIRLPAIVGDFATLILFYRWTRSRWGSSVAQLCSLLLISSTVFMFGSVIALPDSFAVPLGLATIIYAEKGDSRKAGIFLGLALLAKWTVLFIVPGVFYQFYKQKKLGLVHLPQLILIPLLLQAPVIWWNIQHGAVSLIFHLYDRHRHEFLGPLEYLKNFSNFFGAQIFAMGIVPFILLCTILSHLKKHKFNNGGVDWRSVMFWSLPGLAIVLLSSLQGQLRFYWTFLSMIPVIATIGYLVSLNFSTRYDFIKGCAIVLVVTKWLVAAMAGFYPVGPIVEATFNLKPDIRHSPIGEVRGWKRWIRAEVPADFIDAKTALIGSDLHVASRLIWVLRNENMFGAIGVSGGQKNQFQFWLEPAPPQYTKAIFFGDNRYDKLSKFKGQCDHDLDWKISSVKEYDQTIKEVHWAYCRSFRAPAPVLTNRFAGVAQP